MNSRKREALPLFAIAVLIAAVALGLFLSGCSTATTPTDNSTRIAAVVRPIAKNVVIPVLSNNPEYETALLALASAADLAVNGTALTPTGIKAFVDTLASQYDIDENTKIYIASGIDDLVRLYSETYGQAVVDATDPNVKLYLAAFAAGIRDGVQFYKLIKAE